jgi:hypothetical protein
VIYDPPTQRFTLPEEQAFALANENSPAFLPGAFQLATAALKAQPKLLEAFRTGAGVGWHEHDPELFQGTERFFRPGYAAHLTIGILNEKCHRMVTRRRASYGQVSEID